MCSLAALFLPAKFGLSLGVGDLAPSLEITTWLKGDAVDLKAGKDKKIYVLEFWATWCGPCRTSIPHLNELQAKYKDKGVVIIGITDEPANVVKAFMEKQGGKMDYTIALDGHQKTMRTYLGGLGVQGIPHSCVIDKSGYIVWHGSPFDGLDNALDRVVTGKLNIEVARREAKAIKMINEYFDLLIKADRSGSIKAKEKLLEQAKTTMNENFKLIEDNSQLMNALAWNILTHPMIKTRDLELALKSAKASYDLTKGKDSSALDTYARALWDNGRKTEAVKYQREAVALTTQPDQKRFLQETLKKYEAEAASSQPAGTMPASH